ncbi:probable NOT transcription complex subunit VIP2 [Drosophila grimshawi]|uniref:GH22228 n=1 Tax=Drosophila grimshawi TaxID=7222 RepID=B4K3L1_DROGR|nr:probable NOT transcription complex subunit VIP2 [Drosophila grimshawi]EDW05199.1 GH22228 [Drosophila grimshawi]
MPRRRRLRCKVKPLLAADNEASQEEQQNESRSDEPDATTEIQCMPLSVPASASDWEYRLFPEMHNQLPGLPTYTDIFGQHSDVICQESRPSVSASVLTDIFGILGLTAKLRANRSQVNDVRLATGEDLTTYGLDLASQGDIYIHFNGPFTQQPACCSSAHSALELGMRGMRDAMDYHTHKPPIWDPFVPETRNLGLLLPLPRTYP